jgi:putative FmdB family regulatory protein
LPIYEFRCPKCELIVEELRKTGDYSAVGCACCGSRMEKLISIPHTVFSGPGWTKGTWEKAKKRSLEQGRKFYKKYPVYKEAVDKVVYPTDQHGNYTSHSRKGKLA